MPYNIIGLLHHIPAPPNYVNSMRRAAEGFSVNIYATGVRSIIILPKRPMQTSLF